MRKIRVICNDPYATDYSSDDDDSIGGKELTTGKLLVHEISLSSDSGTFKGHSDANDSSRNYPGKVRCESYNNIIEAINVCKKKKTELAMLSGLTMEDDAIEETPTINRLRRRLVVKNMTILETVSGKWAAWTRDQGSNAKTWLGLYNTCEEALESYNRMQLKLESNCNLESPGKGSSSVQVNPQEAVVNNTAKDIAFPIDTDAASFNRPGIKLTKKGYSVVNNTAKDIAFPIDTNAASFNRPGIKLTKKGRWGVRIQHPRMDSQLWLGSYTCLMKAAKAYDKKKSKLDAELSGSHGGKIGTTVGVGNEVRCAGKGSSNVQDNLQGAVVNNTAKDIASPIDTNAASFNRPGIKLTKKGRWEVRIQHPRLDRQQWLGSYKTLEKAAKVYDKKKSRLDAELSASHSGKISATVGVGNEVRCAVDNNIPAYTKKKKGMPARGSATEVIDSKGIRVRYSGVRLRVSGRWSAETRDPRKGSKIHLGTYDTPEEAAAVYEKKRRQLEARICQGRTRSLKDISVTETATLASEAVGVIPETVEPRKSCGKKRKLKDWAEANTERLASETVGITLEGAVVKTEPNNAPHALTLEAENSTLTAVSGQNGGGSNTYNGNPILSSSLEDDDEFGSGVINCHGHYIGEYCKLDEELWII